MATYKCFKCGKKTTHSILQKKFLCSNCGSKIFYKPRKFVVKIKAV
ncbi:MAG: DNA-directed RNA polymerase subunit P [Candidatus Nanoarchaeia archaeon]|nr:DNA-directed RNA polymerase subunit P [Candidatus Pacearchaeota archaeon]MDD5193430.1 DNA-directed RNA polymerase subunit P [Candidatus Nanoarchaeia archaeon]